MSMTITLNPETERLVQEELQSGHFQTIDELIPRGVQAWREKNRTRQTPDQRRAAVARMQEFVKKNRTSLDHLEVSRLRISFTKATDCESMDH